MNILLFVSILFCSCVVSVAGQATCTPKALKVVFPHYPAAAIALNETGIVKIVVDVNKSGNVNSAVAIEGAKWLRPISKDAAEQWTFATPRNRNGKKCLAWQTTLTFEYLLLAEDTKENKDSWSFAVLPIKIVIKRVKTPIDTYRSGPNRSLK